MISAARRRNLFGWKERVVATAALVLIVAPVARGGSEASPAACVKSACVYDIRLNLSSEFTVAKQKTKLSARFPRVALRGVRSSLPGAISLSRGGSGTNRILGTVTGEYWDGTCGHHRRYSSGARVDVRADAKLKRGGGFSFELAPPREVPPKWAAGCDALQGRRLGEVMVGGGEIKRADRRGVLSWGAGYQGFLGVTSLAAHYYVAIRTPQREGSLSSPLRELWAGRNVVVKERFVIRGNGPVLGTTNMTLTFVRR